MTVTTRVCLNGRFLSQPMTGVQRYAMEMVRALDGLLADGKAPPVLAAARWELMVPDNVAPRLSMRHIEWHPIAGSRNPQVWDQLHLWQATRGALLVSFANSGPLLHRRHLVVIHDAAVYRHPEFYSRTYGLLHRSLGRMLARTAKIGTVSNFSRKELAEVLSLKQERIGVFPNGADHLARLEPDDSVLDDLGLRNQPFLLALGSITGNKNVGLAIEAMHRAGLPGLRLVVVGARNNTVFKAAGSINTTNIVEAGRLSDERICALYQHALALVFPSFYEGFGIPPLEAMTFGCPVLASTAGAVIETCGDAASYFDPRDADTLAQLLAMRVSEGSFDETRKARQRARAAEFTWSGSAERLLSAVAAIL